jgi:hypothetical protein
MLTASSTPGDAARARHVCSTRDLNITHLGLLHQQSLFSQIQIGSRNQSINKANQKQTFNMKFSAAVAAVAALSLGGVEGKKKK